MKPVYNDRGMKVPGMYEMGGSTKEYEEGGEQCEMVGWPPKRKCRKKRGTISWELNRSTGNRTPRVKQSKKARRNTGNRR